MAKLKFVDKRPFYIPRLEKYPGGVILPNEKNILEVTDKEANGLLKLKNGNKACFEVVREQQAKSEIIKEA